jgi:hypothetical protein
MPDRTSSFPHGLLGNPQLPPSGKMTGRALPSPERIAAPTYEPPQSSLERMIAKQARRELLGVDPVGLHDNFSLWAVTRSSCRACRRDCGRAAAGRSVCSMRHAAMVKGAADE